MANVAITKKPTAKVRYMTAPSRASGGSRTMSVKWDLASTATDTQRADRISGFEILWDVIMYTKDKKKTKKILHRQYKDSNTGLRTASLNLNEFTSKEDGPKVRDDFYPGREQANKGSLWRVTTVRCFVRTYNAKGNGSWVSTSTDFKLPRAPSVSQLAQSEDSGTVSCTVSIDAGNDLYEVYNGRWELDVVDSSNNTAAGKYHGVGWIARGSTGTVSWDVSDRMRLTYDQYVKVTVVAWARGFFGDSNKVTRETYVSWPARPTITGIDFTKSGTNVDPDGKTTVRVNTNYSRVNNKNVQHPVTGVKLQALQGTTYKKASDIPATEAGNWVDLGAVDDGECTALSAATSELRPDADEVTWVRVKAWNQFEDIFYLYSTPKRLEELEWAAPTAAQDAAVITSLVSGDDGKSAVATIGWHDDNSTHTEISWSQSPNAWRSTDEPDIYGFDWDDGAITVGGVTYNHSATVHIAGLTEGSTYHVRARRYRETDDLTTYGSYYPLNGTLTVTPATSPESVVLSVPEFVARGEALPVTWAYASDAMQTMWQLVTGDITTETDQEGKTVAWVDEPMRVVAEGTDSAGSYVIQPDRVASITDNDSVTLAVIMSTGGMPVASEAVEVRVADAPTVSVSASDVSAQPVSFGVTCSVAASLAVVVTARGSAGEDEILLRPQAGGDALWSAVVMPEWTASGGAKTATVDVSQTLDFRDGAAYEVSVIATDIETGLQSVRATADFEVSWSRQAPEPPEGNIVTVSDTTDSEGYRTRGATIALPDSQSFASGDVMDLYRVTVDGPSLVGSSLQPATTVFDRYAPFGGTDMRYRVAVRTADGDVAWRDYSYTFGDPDPMSTSLRIDYGTDYVEVDRGVTISDGYEKDVKTRKHLDGTTSAYWNAGVSRTSSIAGALIRVYEDDVDAAIRGLARYVGPVMVRTSMGHAYTANVDVSLGTSKTSAGETASLKITAVSSDQYGIEVVE